MNSKKAKCQACGIKLKRATKYCSKPCRARSKKKKQCYFCGRTMKTTGYYCSSYCQKENIQIVKELKAANYKFPSPDQIYYKCIHCNKDFISLTTLFGGATIKNYICDSCKHDAALMNEWVEFKKKVDRAYRKLGVDTWLKKMYNVKTKGSRQYEK